MTGREFLELDSPQQRLYLERFKQMKVIQKMFNELPKADQNLFKYEVYFFPANASLCGLAANYFFRNFLCIRRASFVSALPMAVIPLLSTSAMCEVFCCNIVCHVGELSREVCAVVRGGLIGAVVGGLYPFLPLFILFRYSSPLLPGKENLLHFWLTTAQPVFRKVSLVMLMIITGMYLATKCHGIYAKMMQQMNTSRDPEEHEV
ncbi:T126A protein, partial [Crotophaga sulcirostris]|nr:T126A protein [Crotophaga sulcirostris]